MCFQARRSPTAAWRALAGLLVVRDRWRGQPRLVVVPRDHFGLGRGTADSNTANNSDTETTEVVTAEFSVTKGQEVLVGNAEMLSFGLKVEG